MEVSEEEGESLKEFLEEYWEDATCDVCGENTWSVNTTVFELREFSSGTLNTSGSLLPIIPVHCVNCTNTKFFSAMGLDFIDLEKNDEKEKGEKNNNEEGTGEEDQESSPQTDEA